MSDVVKQSAWCDLRPRLVSAFVLGGVAAACIAAGGVFYIYIAIAIIYC